MSKGSKARPLSVDKETFANNYDRIFGKKEKEEKPVKTQNSSIAGSDCNTCPDDSTMPNPMFTKLDSLPIVARMLPLSATYADPLSEEDARRNAEIDAENANFDISVVDT